MENKEFASTSIATPNGRDDPVSKKSKGDGVYKHNSNNDADQEKKSNGVISVNNHYFKILKLQMLSNANLIETKKKLQQQVNQVKLV